MLFYKQNITDDLDLKAYLHNCDINTSNISQSNGLKGLLNLKEIAYTLNNKNNDKRAGCDEFLQYVIKCL